MFSSVSMSRGSYSRERPLDLNEHATTSPAQAQPVWHVSEGLSLFAGALRRPARHSHSHSVSVFLAGLYEDFALRVGDGAWQRCRSAAIPAGLPYEFDMGGAPLAVLYAEPGRLSAAQLHRLVGPGRQANGAVVGQSGEISVLRQTFEDRDSAVWLSEALEDLAGFAGRSGASIDPRIRRVLRGLRHDHAAFVRADSAAAAANLSASRFQHLFTQEVGVPFRRYRAWCRMRAAISAVLDGSNLTDAAHMAGFSDQPHFSREFRRMFGATPHYGLANARRRQRSAAC